VFCVWGCSSEHSDHRVLHVYAASSLREAFVELERELEADHPHTDVVLHLAGSQVLRLQIEQGAPADVFASANPHHMQALLDSGRVQNSRVFTHNQLALIVPPNNPAGIDSFANLPRAARLVIGTENVPVGRYTRETLRRARAHLGNDFEKAVLARVVSEEHNVRLVRAKVELGEADAALVYQTDAASSNRVHVVPLPAAINVRADYPMGIVEGCENPELANLWLELVFSPAGQAVLSRHGFGVDAP